MSDSGLEQQREPLAPLVNGGGANEHAEFSRADRLAAKIAQQHLAAFQTADEAGLDVTMPDGHHVCFKPYLTVAERGEVERIWKKPDLTDHDKLIQVLRIWIRSWDFTYPNGGKIEVAVDSIRTMPSLWFDYLWAICDELAQKFAVRDEDPKARTDSARA